MTPPVVKQRMAQALALAGRAEREFRIEQLGRTADALWEQRRGEWWSGTTDNYIRVFSRSATEPRTGGGKPLPDETSVELGAGQRTEVRLAELCDSGVRAIPIAAGVHRHTSQAVAVAPA